MIQILAFITATFMGIVGLTYSYSIMKGKIKPVVTTWFLFSVTVALSLSSYLLTATHSFTGNMINVADVAMCWTILLVLVFKNKSAVLHFTKFEIFCLSLSGIIVVFWALTREHAAANVLLQIVLTIAYFPTLVHVWHAEHNTEPLTIWVINWIATLAGFIASILKQDSLGSLYGLRALVLISVLLVLMIRIKRKEGIKSTI